jgi:hydrogenase maturation protein HypF
MERRVIVVRGIVQGVGFRPFVYNLAVRLHLRGFVKNQTGSVLIEVEGEVPELEAFLAELRDHPPPLALIQGLSCETRPPRGDVGFVIEQSTADATSAIFISPDVATCADCLQEMLDPGDRRFGYPFLNCTNCGPRLTIITGAPYDRHRTTMASFVMCAKCRAEYEDPTNRRFHAQPTACAACGPRLQLRDSSGEELAVAEPIAAFVAALRAGRIGALKGLGGYHLACDVGNPAAVAELRRRKQRDEKPFALMVRDVEAAGLLCEVSEEERNLLCSPRRPIVLLRKRAVAAVAEGVAPGNPFLGIMLPYTPLHHLLMKEAASMPLVMTSGNRSDEPIATEDSDALQRLGGIAELFLMHDRPIHVRCDDSVTRVVLGEELPLRRSRGYAPTPVRLPRGCKRPMLAVGGQMKCTFALGRGRHAFLSHHLGDLDHLSAFEAFERDIALYEQLFAIRPELIVHDLHPDYASTRYAQRRCAGEKDTPALLAVQHHQAHVASCMAEHGLDEPVIGVAFDGTGYGSDGAIWGGEVFVGDYGHFRRAAHLRYVGMPGGEQAIREPWRMAVAHLHEAGVDVGVMGSRVPGAQLRIIERMLERRVSTPWTSSMGRLFDAVAALAGVRMRTSYEGQAAMELEWLAMQASPAGAYPFALVREEGSALAPVVVDTRSLIRAVAEDVVRGTSPAVIARRFHATVVDLIVEVCGRLREETGLTVVVLSGGVMLNVLVAGEASERLSAVGYRVYRHRVAPPGDGGLALGQVAIAAMVDRGR